MSDRWRPPSPEEARVRIEEMVRRIAARFDPAKVILFGSHARGDAGPDSDVDLLVVAESSDPEGLAVEIHVALSGLGLPKDIAVVSPEEFERHRDLVGTIVYPAAHEGKILYERAA